MAKADVEERDVEMSDLTAGVKLKAGHPVHLLVGGVKGQGTPAGDPSGGASTPADPSGSDPTSTPGGGSTPGGSTGTGDPSGSGGGTPTGGPSGDASTPPDPSGGGTATGTDPSGGGSAAGGGTATGGGTGTADQPPEPTPSKKVVFDAAHFETDKAFPLPAALQAFRAIAKLATDEPARALLVLGHTDAVGPAAHNRGLSMDRANTVATYLKNDVDGWTGFFDDAPSSKKWGTREIQHMLTALPWDGDKYLKRDPADVSNADVRAAMARFQKANKLPATANSDKTGVFDKASRKKLIEAYMAADGTTAPAPTPINTLGCGQAHLKVATKSANAENRRVEVLAFEKADYTPSTADYDGGSAEEKSEIYQKWLGASAPVTPAPAPTEPAPKDPAPAGPGKLTPFVFSDSWTSPDSQGHRPGEGRDFSAGDVTLAEYEKLGILFGVDVAAGLATKSDEDVLAVFRQMAQTLFTHGELNANTDAMIDKFGKKESGDWKDRTYSNDALTKLAREHQSTRRFVDNLRRAVGEQLGAAGGDPAKLTRYTKNIKSPMYSTAIDKFDGLTIAINDTWAYEVTLDECEVKGNTFKAKLSITLYDHFGLDQDDVVTYGTLAGFRAWYLLQHVRGFNPFVTKLVFDEQVEGSF